ncbi:hypothetical protein EB796_009219 [Bugula neritina]|uniref:Uncharacterized protein n=1 Tax=Bugula neritina TaxID=10212 RepID=A0A7J7K2Q5_BUGNE|nr:hypothetical protein EB796_009219 [Bugula neritina]
MKMASSKKMCESYHFDNSVPIPTESLLELIRKSLHFVLWQHVHKNFLYGTNLFVDCVSTFSLEQSRKKFGNCIMTSATVVSSSLENY